MTRPLTSSMRQQLDATDTAPLWGQIDPDTMRMQVAALRDAYPMADIRLAQFLMETAQGIEGVLSHGDEELRNTLRGYQAGLVTLASAVSRRARGKPEV